MKKRIVAILAALALAASFTGCGNSSTEESTASESSTADTEEQSGEDDVPIVDETVEEKGIDAFVEVPGYDSMELEKQVTVVTDEDVENEIASQLTYYPQVCEEGTVIEKGMTVNCDYTLMVDGEQHDAGTGVDFEMGSANLIEGFSEQIIGHKKGEVLDFECTFPEDYGDTEIAGKAGSFHLTVNEVKKILSEPTDEWVRENFDYSTVDEFREGTRQYLEEDAALGDEEEFQNTVMTAVLDLAKFKQLPRDMVDRYNELQENSFKTYAEQMGVEYNDEFLTNLGYTKEQLEEVSCRYAKMELATRYIIEKENVNSDSEVYKEQEERVLGLYGFAGKDDALAAGIDELNYDLVIRNYVAVELVKQHAKITEVSPSDGEASGQSE
ncbi:MAG: FKBP-type peptidyl-prolyl cis-trans isomerase [Lachnospiraceae bacterium]|jgi:trigger factor